MNSLPTDDLDALKDDPGVLHLYTSRLRLKREGKLYVASCPFHHDKTPSFKIEEKSGRWLWMCYGGCQKGGTIIDFIAEMDHISIAEAITKIKSELGHSWEGQKKIVERTFKPVAEEKKKTFTVYPLAKYEPWEKALAENKEAQEWLLRERGITYETAQRFRLGYRQSITSNAADAQEVLDKGWIVFPSIDGDQIRLIKFRSIAKKVFARQPNMETVLFNTNTIDPTDDLYVVAGEFDALSLEQAGFHAVSLPADSTPITPEIKDQLMKAGRVILAGDSDQSGQTAMDKLDKLWYELLDPDRPVQVAFRLHWSTKDANELWTSTRNLSVFRQNITDLTNAALSQPMPGVYSLAEAMLASGKTNLSDHPQRLHFPWPTVDKMAILLPGSVMSIMATNTKMGKTCFVVDLTVEAAIKQQEVVLNYQCELSTDEMANMVASYLLRKHRNHLERPDYQAASKVLTDSNVRYYVGRDPSLNTVTPVLDLIEAAIRRFGATIVVLDHIHFICRNEANQTEAEANAMQRIKSMAQKYKVKFIVVGQPRKATQQNKGKIVHITDWKGSETGTSDADAVFAIHRNCIKIKDPNNPPMDDYEPRTEIHLLGARSRGDGATFAILQFFGQWATFEELTTAVPEHEEIFG